MLEHVAGRGAVGCIELICDAGADPNEVGAYGSPPLDYATNDEAIDALLKKGADPAVLVAAVSDMLECVVDRAPDPVPETRRRRI